MRSRLPGELAPPLHLLEPFPLWPYILLAFLLGLLVLLIYLRRRRSKPVPAAPPAQAPRPLAGIDQLEAAVRELQVRHSREGSYRQGCHELADLLRDRLESPTGTPLSRLTALEMAELFEEGALPGFFEWLADLRFRRRAPLEHDLDQACSLAMSTARGQRLRRIP